MTRAEFIKKSTLAVFLLPTLLYQTSCKEDPELVVDEESCLDNGTNSTIGLNHGHNISVSRFDVEAGEERTYNIQGTATHNHSVVVTATDFSLLKTNQKTTVVSSSDSGHTHSVVVTCA